jgi:CHAD domain-containing protein
VNQFLLEAMDQRWKNYRAELMRCRSEFSNEAVHDLRASARRMLAIFQLLNFLSPRPRLQKLNRAFKDQLDEFDDLRDTQVILAEISETVQELPQLQGFQGYLQEVEKKLLKTLRKKLKVIDLFDVSKRIRRMRESLKAEADANGDLVEKTLQAVDDAFLITKQRQNWINAAQANTIHRVRLAFKTFRYMVEIVHPLLDDFPAENLKYMHDYQSLMGEIQDVEVIMQALADAPQYVAAFDPEPVRRHYEQCHADAISAYLAAMDRLAAFWRPAPDQPFPWEK